MISECINTHSKFWSSVEQLHIVQGLCPYRSSHSLMFSKIVVLKNFVIFTGKQLYWSLFLIKLQAWKTATLLKRDSNTCVFLWILQIFRNSLFYRTPAVAASAHEFHPAWVLSFAFLCYWKLLISKQLRRIYFSLGIFFFLIPRIKVAEIKSGWLFFLLNRTNQDFLILWMNFWIDFHFVKKFK